MNKLKFFLLLFLSFSAQAEQSNILSRLKGQYFENKLRPFSTDGCSRFFDGIPFGNSTKWVKCCIDHDVAYWKGGTAEERFLADQKLGQCVEKTGENAIGSAMRLGVRLGGLTGLPTTWNWGYGWVIPRGYAPLTTAEKNKVKIESSFLNNIYSLPIVSNDITRNRETLTGDHCIDLAAEKIEQQVGSGFVILDISTQNSANSSVYLKTISVRTNLSDKPFVFYFHLLRESACTDQMSEFVARGRIRLLGMTH